MGRGSGTRFDGFPDLDELVIGRFGNDDLAMELSPVRNETSLESGVHLLDGVLPDPFELPGVLPDFVGPDEDGGDEDDSENGGDEGCKGSSALCMIELGSDPVKVLSIGIADRPETHDLGSCIPEVRSGRAGG